MTNTVKQLSVVAVNQLLSEGADIELIDVREAFEKDFCDINGKPIPLGEVEQRFTEIDKSKPVVVYCRSGGRSQKAAEFLVAQGYNDVSNMIGGMLAWIDEIDPSMQKY